MYLGLKGSGAEIATPCFGLFFGWKVSQKSGLGRLRENFYIHAHVARGGRLSHSSLVPVVATLLGLIAAQPSRTGFVATTLRLRQQAVVSLPLQTVASA
jgi:hypothetical protein